MTKNTRTHPRTHTHTPTMEPLLLEVEVTKCSCIVLHCVYVIVWNLCMCEDVHYSSYVYNVSCEEASELDWCALRSLRTSIFNNSLLTHRYSIRDMTYNTRRYRALYYHHGLYMFRIGEFEEIIQCIKMSTLLAHSGEPRRLPRHALAVCVFYWAYLYSSEILRNIAIVIINERNNECANE